MRFADMYLGRRRPAPVSRWASFHRPLQGHRRYSSWPPAVATGHRTSSSARKGEQGHGCQGQRHPSAQERPEPRSWTQHLRSQRQEQASQQAGSQDQRRDPYHKWGLRHRRCLQGACFQDLLPSLRCRLHPTVLAQHPDGSELQGQV